jgi:hypothetical protein
VYLHFDRQVTIKIEGEFSHQAGAVQSGAGLMRMPVSESRLMGLLEDSISSAAAEGSGTLVLVFDNGHVLRCFETAGYESYEIKNGNDVLVV